MNASNILFKPMMGLAALTLVTACAGKIKKADIADTANPRDEIARLEKDLQDARSRDVDVLAEKDFKKSEKWVSDAKEDLADGKKQEKILDDVRYAQSYLNEANQTAADRRQKLPTLFEARQAAVTAGVMNHPELKKDFSKIDDQVSDKADNLSDLKTEKIAKLQQEYIDIERRAVILTELAPAISKVNGAKKDKADKKAPNTLKNAEIDLKNAENMISTNVRNKPGFAAAVAKSNASSTLLTDVMATINQNGKNLPEATALKLVSQTKRIDGLQGELVQTQGQLNQTQGELNQTEASKTQLQAAAAARLNQSNKALTQAEQTVAMQKAIEEARSQFSPDEAEAYQQGSALMIRLKKMNFSSGRSDLPADSMALLAKVTEVAKTLNAEDIKVEGHTDGVGTEAKNQTLSQKRADSVAQYLKTNGFEKVEAEGHGFSKPLASNKTKEGRAQNRRVDITIIPGNGSAAPAEKTVE